MSQQRGRDKAKYSVDSEMLELLERDPAAYFRATHKPFPKLENQNMLEFLRSKGFKPGPADGNPPEIWFNGVPYQHPGTFWNAPDYWGEAVQHEKRRGETMTDKTSVDIVGPARMTSEIEQIKTCPDRYFRNLHTRAYICKDSQDEAPEEQPADPSDLADWLYGSKPNDRGDWLFDYPGGYATIQFEGDGTVWLGIGPYGHSVNIGVDEMVELARALFAASKEASEELPE